MKERYSAKTDMKVNATAHWSEDKSCWVVTVEAEDIFTAYEDSKPTTHTQKRKKIFNVETCDEAVIPEAIFVTNGIKPSHESVLIEEIKKFSE